MLAETRPTTAGIHQSLFRLHTPAASDPSPDDVTVPDSSEGAATDIQICCAMMADHPISRSSAALQPVTSASRELVQYHHSQHYLTIIGEALSKKDKRRHMTRIVLDGMDDMRPRAAHRPIVGPDDRPDPLAGLDEIDREYLLKKRVLDLPPRECVYVLPSIKPSAHSCLLTTVYHLHPPSQREYFQGLLRVCLPIRPRFGQGRISA